MHTVTNDWMTDKKNGAEQEWEKKTESWECHCCYGCFAVSAESRSQTESAMGLKESTRSLEDCPFLWFNIRYWRASSSTSIVAKSANRVRTTAFKKSQCHDFSSLSAPFSTFRTEYGVDFVGLSLFRHGLRSAYPIRKAHCTCYESLSIEIRNSNISATWMNLLFFSMY